MPALRLLVLVSTLSVLGCSSNSTQELPSKPQDLIVGRWEADDVGLEFTSSGTILSVGHKETLPYQFVDDRTIEVVDRGHRMQITDVTVSKDEFVGTSNGKTKKFKRVKEFSAQLHAHMEKNRQEASQVAGPSTIESKNVSAPETGIGREKSSDTISEPLTKEKNPPVDFPAPPPPDKIGVPKLDAEPTVTPPKSR